MKLRRIFYLSTVAVIISIAAGLRFTPSDAHAATLTVCPSGCQHSSISSAVSQAATGDVVRVGPGTYSGFTLSKQITIESEDYNIQDVPANPVKIQGQVVINGNWPWDQGPVIRGFAIEHNAHVVVGNAPYTLEYSYIVANRNDGVSFEKGSGGIARGNYIENSGDDCIDVDAQAKDILIENNQLINCGQDGIEIRQQDVSIPSRATLTFRNNIINGTGEDGLQIMDYNNFSNRRYIFERNLVMNTGTAGIGIMPGTNTNQDYSAGPLPEALYVVNNTFVNNDAGISGGTNLIALNNIFQGSKSFDLKGVTGDSVIKNSLFSTPPKLQGSNNLDQATTRVGNPLLDSAFVPQTGSPAIDGGIASYQHTYSSFTDTVINLTPSQYSGSAPDIGWKESGATGGGPTATITPIISGPPSPTTLPPVPSSLTFAVIGDYGRDNTPQANVANVVKSWNPDFIITTGDNNYPDGEASTMDNNVGKYYGDFIGNYKGSFGAGSPTNRFWPSLGNHDWGNKIQTINCSGSTCTGPYFDYFTLPGNERYYDVDLGLIHLFAIDSDRREPDGREQNSVQAQWFQNAIAASDSCYNVVFFHHPPYSSGMHGSAPPMQWPFATWGVDAVFNGHDHLYERLEANGIPFVVAGASGTSLYSFDNLGNLPAGVTSHVRYADDHGALKVTATTANMTYEYFNSTGQLIDTHVVPATKQCAVSGASPSPNPTGGTCARKTQGDVNCDNAITIFDLSALLRVFGTNDPDADIDGQVGVTLFDLNILLSNFGS